MNHIEAYIPISEVFPNVKNDFPTFKSLLQGLSLTDTLFWCSRLNLIVSGSEEIDHFTKQQSCLRYEFFTSKEISVINNFSKQHGDARNIAIFFRGQLLELLRWATLICQDLPGDGTTHGDPDVKRRFSQAALIASDIWSRRVYKKEFSLSEGIQKTREKAVGPFLKGLESTKEASIIYRSLGRGWLFFNNYFPRYYRSFNEEFYKLTELSLKDYYFWTSALILSYVNYKRDEGIFSTTLQDSSKEMERIFKKYLSLFSQTSDELREALWAQTNNDISDDKNAPAYYYKPLREKPILCTSDRRAIILDPVFFSEKAMVGPLFLLTKDKIGHEANELFTAFGKAFEDYTTNILNRMFPDLPCITNKRLETRIKKVDLAGKEFEIDACLNDIIEVVVFEIKAVWLREDEMMSDDYEACLNHIREKYIYGNEMQGERKTKGLSQIVRIINQLALKEWRDKNKEFSELKTVYPVLIVHDPNVSSPLFGHFLAAEFNNLLDPDEYLCPGHMIKGELHIAPLIIITIEDLENLEESIKHFGFKDLLADYSRTHPDRLVSLHNYLATSEYKNKLRHNKALVDKGLELLNKCNEIIESKNTS